MSISDSNDLSKANDLLDKLGDTFKDFESHSLSILTLSDQWRILQNSLVGIHNSLGNRVKEVESRERDKQREIEVTKRRLQNIELRYKKFKLRERSMEERLKEVNMKEKQVKELCEGLELEKRMIEERCKAVESREKEVEESANGVDLRVKLIDQLQEAVEEKAKELSEFSEELKLKEGVLSEKFLVLERKEEELESKGKEMDELYNVIMLKEKEFNEGKENLVAQQKMLRSSLEEVNGLLKGIELKEREIVERFEVLEAKEKEYQECVKKMGLKEREIVGRCEVLETKEKEYQERVKRMGLKEREIVERCELLEAKEKKFQEGVEILGLKVKELSVHLGRAETREKDVQETFKALRVEEIRINEKTKALDLREEELNKRYQMVELKEKLVDDQQHGFELQKKEIIELCEKIGLKGKQVNEGQKALESKEKQIDNRCKDSILKEKDIDMLYRAMGTNEKHVNIEKGNEALELKETQIEERSKIIETKEKEVMEFNEAVELNKKEVDKGNEALKLKEMQIDERCKRVELKEKELNEQYQALDTKEKHIANDVIKAPDFTEEQMNENQIGEPCIVEEFTQKQIVGCSLLAPCDSNKLRDSQVDSFSSKLRGEIPSLCKNMDPNGLSSYLIEHLKELKLKNKELLDALRSAPNPAKLVLDVSQKFHQKFACSNQTNACKNSCIFLLGQLVKLSPPISHVKNEAKVFAASWKARLKGADVIIDTYGFLWFLAAFKLASLYDADELLSMFDIFYCENEVYRLDDIPCLCRALGLFKKIPGRIIFLIERQNWLLALKYVCIFKLESDFPPVPLLEAHLELLGRIVNDRQNDGTSKIQASQLELDGLKEVVECVTFLNFEHKFAVDSLVSRIHKLKSFKENRKTFAHTLMKKRNASSCTSLQYLGQKGKRPRIGHNHHVHQGNISASSGPSNNAVNPHLFSGQFVPLGNHPLGVPMPVYRGVKAEVEPGWSGPLAQARGP